MNRSGFASFCLLLLSSAAFAVSGKLEPTVEYVHEDAAGKLEMIGEVAVVIGGDEPFISRIMEDVLAITMLGKGIRVAYPEETHFGKPRRERDADPMQIAVSVGANTLVTGTVVTEPPGEFQFRTVKVSIASLSVVDVPQDKTLIWALYEPEQATTTSRIAQTFAAFVVENLE